MAKELIKNPILNLIIIFFFPKFFEFFNLVIILNFHNLFSLSLQHFLSILPISIILILSFSSYAQFIAKVAILQLRCFIVPSQDSIFD